MQEELRNKLSKQLALEVAGKAQTQSPDGHFLQLEGGVAYPRASAEVLASLLLLKRLNQAPTWADAVIESSIVSMEKLQRENGLWGEPTCNPSSPADAGFLTQLLCEGVEHLRSSSYYNKAIDTRLGALIEKTHEGMSRGGHHTPNHRWVIASALVRMEHLYGFDSAPCVDQYRKEGLDINSDGAWLERSAGGYDAVNDRCMQFLWKYAGWDEALHAADSNLNFVLSLIQPDLSVETALSTRWDYGKKTFPLHISDCFIRSGSYSGNTEFVEFALKVVDHFTTSFPLTSAFWTLSSIVTEDIQEGQDAGQLRDIDQLYPETGCWRLRSGKLALTALTDTRKFFKADYGAACLQAIRVQQAYMGDAGHFIADQIYKKDGEISLLSEGKRHYRRPAYDLPLEEPVGHTWDDWHKSEAFREQIKLEPARMEFKLKTLEGGVLIQLETTGTDNVPGMVSIDFNAGGIWYTESCVLKPVESQELILSNGYGEMHYGTDIIEIGTGRSDFIQFNMRDADPIGKAVRVLIPFINPASFSIKIGFRSNFRTKDIVG